MLVNAVKWVYFPLRCVCFYLKKVARAIFPNNDEIPNDYCALQREVKKKWYTTRPIILTEWMNRFVDLSSSHLLFWEYWWEPERIERNLNKPKQSSQFKITKLSPNVYLNLMWTSFKWQNLLSISQSVYAMCVMWSEVLAYAIFWWFFFFWTKPILIK